MTVYIVSIGRANKSQVVAVYSTASAAALYVLSQKPYLHHYIKRWEVKDK